MKYIVEVKYTNPAHEHVSLRRRVDTVRRVVEAATETEAINRVSNQQRSLGYIIREAVVLKEEQSKATPELVAEETQQIDEISNADLRKTDAYKNAIKNIRQKRLNREFSKGGAEDTPSHELKMPTKNQSVKIDHRLGKIVNAYREEVEVVDEATPPEKGYADAMRTASDVIFKTDSDKRVAGYKNRKSVAAAQKISDLMSKRVARPQAGTLAAKKVNEEIEQAAEEVKYIEEKLTSSDPASKWIHDFVHSDNPKFAGKSKKERIQQALGAYYAKKRSANEEVEHIEEDSRVVNKEVKSDKEAKTADTIINLAKSKKNKVDAKPTLDVTGSEKKYVKV